MEGNILHRFWRTGIAALTLVMSASGMAAMAAEPVTPAGLHTQFRLLQLEREIARWHTNGGSPAIVRYAILDQQRRFPGVRNCGGMQPLDRLAARSGITRDVFARELAKAARQWEQVANIRFIEVSDESQASLLIGAQTEPSGRAFTNVELTEPAGDAPRSISRALICLNPQMPWKIGFDGNLGAYDLRYTLAHELGHVIGLDHPGASGQLMGFRYTEAFDTLQPGDIAGAVALYGKPQDNIRAATTTSSPSASPEAAPTPARHDSPQDRAGSLALGEPGADQ